MKKDNKGFSLVELIIVIAIMAILVGIVGSQVLPYLNKSREAKDQQILSGWVTAALSAYSANAAELTDTSYVITITPTAAGLVAQNNPTCTNTTLKNAFLELTGLNSAGVTFSSTMYKAISNLQILVTPTSNPVVSIQSITYGNNSYNTAKGTVNTTELVAK